MKLGVRLVELKGSAVYILVGVLLSSDTRLALVCMKDSFVQLKYSHRHKELSSMEVTSTSRSSIRILLERIWRIVTRPRFT